MKVKRILPKEKVVLTARDRRGEFVQLDIKDHLKDRSDSILGHGDESEEFKVWLNGKPQSTWDIRAPHSEAFPEGRILHGCHVHRIDKNPDGGYAIDISWTDEFSITKMVCHWHREKDGTIRYEH